MQVTRKFEGYDVHRVEVGKADEAVEAWLLSHQLDEWEDGQETPEEIFFQLSRLERIALIEMFR